MTTAAGPNRRKSRKPTSALPHTPDPRELKRRTRDARTDKRAHTIPKAFSRYQLASIGLERRIGTVRVRDRFLGVTPMSSERQVQIADEPTAKWTVAPRDWLSRRSFLAVHGRSEGRQGPICQTQSVKIDTLGRAAVSTSKPSRTEPSAYMRTSPGDCASAPRARRCRPPRHRCPALRAGFRPSSGAPDARKTGGNPFFAIKFLTALAGEGLRESEPSPRSTLPYAP